MKKTIKDIEDKILQAEKKLNEARQELIDYKRSQKIVAEVGDVVEIAGIEWLILDITEEGYLAITNELIDVSMEFDALYNEWKESKLSEYLNVSILPNLENEVGLDGIVRTSRNLISLDGQTEYGVASEKISLLTVDEYRKYRKLLPNIGKFWWLITPFSTERNYCDHSVCAVSPSGNIVEENNRARNGVRPFCIFSASLFESDK